MSPFHLFHLSLIGQLWWVLCFLFGCCFVGLLLLLLIDQSLRSSYLPMTSLAQFRDCHSCYDERSIDQKKKANLQPSCWASLHKISCIQIVVATLQLADWACFHKIPCIQIAVALKTTKAGVWYLRLQQPPTRV